MDDETQSVEQVETTAVPTAMAASAESVDAWSECDDAEADEQPSRRRWVLAAGVFAMSVAAVAIAAGVYGARTHHEPAGTPVPEIKSSAPQEIPQKRPTIDNQFIEHLDRLGVPYRNRQTALGDAHSICNYLSETGHRFSDLSEFTHALMPYFELRDKSAFTSNAIGAYCPKYQYLYAEDNSDDHATS